MSHTAQPAAANAASFAAAMQDYGRALVVGDYPGAVAACMRAGRLGDALVLASVGGTDLWLRTQAEYMRRSRRQYMSVVAAVVKNDLNSLVRQRPLAHLLELLPRGRR